MEANDITDRVPRDLPISRDIGFTVAERYNASEILFDNLSAGRGGKIAVYSDGGNATYGELCAAACRVGNALAGQGLAPHVDRDVGIHPLLDIGQIGRIKHSIQKIP